MEPMMQKQEGSRTQPQRALDTYFAETVISNKVRIDNLEDVMKEIKEALVEIRRDLQEVKMDVHDIRSKAQGGWQIILVLCSALMGVVSIGAALWGAFH